MGKVRRSIWKPLPTVVEVGQTEYTVEPQPMRRYMEFEERLRELVTGLWGEEEAEEPEEIEGTEGTQEAEATVEEPDVGETVAKGLIEQGVEMVYDVLQCLIPDLAWEDVLDAPEPQLEHALEVCLKANGGKWAEALVKDFFAPILPALQGALVELLLRVLPTPTESGEPAETT